MSNFFALTCHNKCALFNDFTFSMLVVTDSGVALVLLGTDYGPRRNAGALVLVSYKCETG
ncbi:hypothetical protein Hanom_Chr11g01029691 [Helianthus anomalus]